VKKIHSGLIIFLLISLPVLACGWGRSRAVIPTPTIAPTPTPLPQPPRGQITPQPTESQRAKQNFNQALQETGPDHAFQFRITSEEITSLAAIELRKQADIPVSEPQIWFTNGKIYLAGKVEGVGPSPVPALIVATPVINGNDQLQIQIEEAKMGNFKLPKAMVENLTKTINDTLADTPLEIEIEAVSVLEGELVITGRRTE